MPDVEHPTDPPEARRDDSGEHALAKAEQLEGIVLGKPDDEADAGVLGHLRHLDHAVYAKNLVTKGMWALLLINLIALALNLYLTAERSTAIERIDDAAARTDEVVARVEGAVARIEASEGVNQDLNRQMLEALGRVDQNAAQVAQYVAQAQAAAAAGAGSSARVLAALDQIDRIAAELGLPPVQPAQGG